MIFLSSVIFQPYALNVVVCPLWFILPGTYLCMVFISLCMCLPLSYAQPGLPSVFSSVGQHFFKNLFQCNCFQKSTSALPQLMLALPFSKLAHPLSLHATHTSLQEMSPKSLRIQLLLKLRWKNFHVCGYTYDYDFSKELKYRILSTLKKN